MSIDLPTPLRAITLHPWWAYAITHGDKRIEYRTRPLPVDLIGVPVALHAGASSPGEREPKNWWIECDRIHKARVIGAPIDDWRAAGCHSSAFVAVVVFDRTVSSIDLPMRWRCAEFVGWRIGKVVRLKRPILGPGAQGWWKVSDECRAAIVAQMEGMT